MLEKSTDKAYTYRYFDGETELTEDIYLMTGDAVLTVKKEAVKITVPADVDKLELTYKKAMTEVDLNSYVENAADLGKLTFKVDDASQAARRVWNFPQTEHFPAHRQRQQTALRLRLLSRRKTAKRRRSN